MMKTMSEPNPTPALAQPTTLHQKFERFFDQAIRIHNPESVQLIPTLDSPFCGTSDSKQSQQGSLCEHSINGRKQ